MDMRRVIKDTLKTIASRTIYRQGSLRTILFGPCRGLKYRIFPSGLSYLYGGPEPQAQKIMLQNLKQGGTAYDVGANYGMHTLLMARLVGASGHVYAFEPNSSAFQGLLENIQLNGFHHVTCVQAGVWDHSGRAQFFTSTTHTKGYCAEAGEALGHSSEIEVFSLDDFAFEKRYRPPDFIKVDVEGGEAKVLSGARRVLEAYHPVLLIELHSQEQDVAVRTMLAQMGYPENRAILW